MNKIKGKDSFVNIGLDRILVSKTIVGIFDMDSTTVKKDTRDYLKRAENHNEVEVIAPDLPASFVVCSEKKKKQKILLTSFTVATLYARTQRKFP